MQRGNRTSARRGVRVLGIAITAALLLVACGEDKTATSTTVAETTQPSEPNATDTTAGDGSGTLRVPDDYPTIQAAVDAAEPGALILIAPGTYNEAVQVETDELTIRGLDRNTVILDGKLELDNGIRVLGAKGVAVENMTAQNYTHNGFFWTGVQGYRGSYLTSYRSGDYGVYAFDSVDGQLEHIYAAGSPDAGIYIGECYPCNAVVDDVVSEHNGLGYSGTNSGGNLLIVNSIWRFNRAGIVPNSGSYELCYPSRDTTIVGNVVYSNNQADTPAIDVAILAMGNGIVAAGAVKADIARNLVYDHDKAGIALVPFLEEDPNDDAPTPEEWDQTCEEQKQTAPVKPSGPVLWHPQQNKVTGNVVAANRLADILLATVDADISTLGNCFSKNNIDVSLPNNLQTLAPCEGTGAGDWKDGEYNIAQWLIDANTAPPSVDWKTAPLPPLEDQENMKDAETAAAHPATDVPFAVNVGAIDVPAKPAG
ncbi:MAG: right-handed parallel beta-helix repeat-containing protein [Ilumatobacteraceae bacterium]